MQSPIFRSGPLSIGDLLDWAIRLYRARFGKLILTTAIFLVPLGVLSGIISGQTMTSYLQIFINALQNPDILADQQLLTSLQADSDLVALSYLLIPVSIAAGGLVTLALTRQSIAAIQNQELSIWGGLRTGIQRFGAWLGMTLAIYAVYFGVAILITIVLFIIVFVLAIVASGFMSFGNLDQGGEPGIVAFAGLMVGVVCLYVGIFVFILSPFIYLSTRWAVAIPVIIDQNLGPLEALSESWKLTKDNVRRSVAYVILIYLFYGVIYGAFMTIAIFISSLTLSTSSFASMAIFGVIGALLPILWQPIASAAYTMLYYDLRMRNQSYDVELQIQQLEAEVVRGAYASA